VFPRVAASGSAETEVPYLKPGGRAEGASTLERLLSPLGNLLRTLLNPPKPSSQATPKQLPSNSQGFLAGIRRPI
jgi:hypothetical protein